MTEHSQQDARVALAASPPGEAIQRLMKDSGDKIFGLGLKLCGNRQDAEDLVQETFLQAFRKWDQFEGRSKPSSWLYTIAARICQRRHRRRAGEPSRLESLEELLPVGEETVVDLRSGQDGPFADRLHREAVEVVDDALAGLPVEFRLPLVLKEIAELSLREIAGILGVKEATVKTRVHRARMALRREVAAVLPRRSAAAANHPRQICLSLLRSKLEAIDRGVDLPDGASRELCTRCEALFDSLDLTVEACRWVRAGELPEALRARLVAELAREG